MDYKTLSSQLVRSLRGKRSQPQISRWLGYKSNAVYLWESGRNSPTAAKLFALARRVGVSPTEALVRFYSKPGDWVSDVDLTQPAGVTRLLNDLRGNRSHSEIARAMGRDRYAVSRWFNGKTQPRLPEFLELVELCTLRLLDFVACLVDPATLPLIKKKWTSLSAARATATDAPWSQAVLYAIELTAYKRLPRHVGGWIAERVGISLEEEQESLKLLSQSGQIRWVGRRWSPRAVGTVDTRPDPQASRKLATWCAAQGVERLETEGSGNFAFNVFAVSASGHERLRQLQRDYFSELREIVAESKSADRVLVANMQLFTLER